MIFSFLLIKRDMCHVQSKRDGSWYTTISEKGRSWMVKKYKCTKVVNCNGLNQVFQGNLTASLFSFQIQHGKENSLITVPVPINGTVN